MLPCYRVVNLFLPRSCLSRACIGALTARTKPDLSGSFQKHCSSLKVSCCRQLNGFVETLHDDLTPRSRLRHDSSPQQAFGGTLARKTQLVQSILYRDERSGYSLVIVEQIIQSFKFVDWCCRKNADFDVARQRVNNLPLHVIHVGFIGNLLNSKRLVVHVKGRKARNC